MNCYTYRPFGAFYDGECVETVENPFCFTGQWYDDEIGQYYLRARQYDPIMMRFTSRDPVRGKLQEPLTLHKYLYCQNNPVNYIDPDGRVALVIGGSISFNSGEAGSVIGNAMTVGGNMLGGAKGSALSVCMGAMARSAILTNAANITGGTFGFGSVVGYNLKDHKFFGGSMLGGAAGVGLGINFTATADFAVSNANSLDDLRGGFMEVGGTVPFANSIFLNGVIGGSISKGLNSDIYLATISIGGSAGMSAGTEAHAYVGYSEVWEW
ncbi:MAG: RHS repeat-associated core domain-containing protein [Sedimentisphaerales bacterium]|nr:RHS repeat-associated core domain-containing protein [Sedimentisphaerales bacterium]